MRADHEPTNQPICWPETVRTIIVTFETPAEARAFDALSDDQVIAALRGVA